MLDTHYYINNKRYNNINIQEGIFHPAVYGFGCLSNKNW